MWPNVSWYNLVQRLLPKWWRQPRMLAWLTVCISQVQQLHGAFLSFRTITLYDMRLNGQTIYLEKGLNDRFDDDERRIYIETVEDPSQFYLYRIVEGAPQLFIYRRWASTQFYYVDAYAMYDGKVWQALTAHSNITPVEGSDWTFVKDYDTYIRRKGESLQPYDFIVWVPVALVFDTYELQALVNRYKQAGKRYSIQTFA
jgi:hypothetical protein